MKEIFTTEEIKNWIFFQIEECTKEGNEISEKTSEVQSRFNQFLDTNKIADAMSEINDFGLQWGIQVGKGMMLEKLMEFLGIIKNIDYEKEEVQ